MKKLLSLISLLLVLTTSWAQSNPVVPTGATQTVAGTKYYIHVVQPGQTVFSISRAYGLHYSAAVIKTDIHNLSVGDTVWIPFNDQSQAAVQRAIGQTEAAEPTQSLKVEQGMTLYSLCRNYGVTLEQLYRLNPALEQEGLKAGQTILLPADAKPKSPASTPKASTPAPKPTAPASKAEQPKSEQPKAPAQPKSSTTTAAPQGQYSYQENASPAPEAPTRSSAQGAVSAVLPAVRERVSADKVVISLMMPLRLDRMEEISTTKFDVDQRGKKDYRSFEFIQFYEGILMGLDDLEKSGVNVVLNVVDVSSDKPEDIRRLYASYNVAQSDLLIALLPHAAFDEAASLAKRDHLFIVSPLATRDDLLSDNPYAIKYMPSSTGMVRTMLDNIAADYPGSTVYIIHSNHKNEAVAKAELESQLKQRNIRYSFFDWSQNAKLASTLKAANHPVVISIYDQGKDKNRIYSNLLLNRLASLKSDPPVLYTLTNYLKDIPDVDFNQLQMANYHLFYAAYLDYTQPAHQQFIDDFKSRFKTQPVNGYAPVGHDLIIFFATGLQRRGSSFWSNINAQKPATLLFPVHYSQAPAGGFENQAAELYRMVDFHLERPRR